MSAARMRKAYAPHLDERTSFMRTNTLFHVLSPRSCSFGGEGEQAALPAHLTLRQVDGALAVAVRVQAGRLEGLGAREAHAELAAHDVADDAVPQRRRVGLERSDRDSDARLGVLDDVLDRLVDHVGEGLVVLPKLLGRAPERLGDARDRKSTL